MPFSTAALSVTMYVAHTCLYFMHAIRWPTTFGVHPLPSGAKTFVLVWSAMICTGATGAENLRIETQRSIATQGSKCKSRKRIKHGCTEPCMERLSIFTTCSVFGWCAFRCQPNFCAI